MRIRDQKNLYKENRESFNLCSALIRLSSLALSQADPDRIVSQALKNIRKIFNAKICWLFLVEDNEIKFKSLGETRSTQNLIKSQLLPKLSPEILKRTYPIICNRIGELYKNNRALYKFLNGKRIHKFMGVPLKKDGKLVGALNLARDSSSPSFTQEDMKSLAFLGTWIGITRGKQAEEKLRQSQDFLEAIIDNIPNPVFIKDRKHRWVVLNQALSDLLGYPREKMLGNSDHSFFPKEQADFFWKKDEEMFRTGRVIDIPEEPITDKEGNIHYLHTKKAPLRDSSGRITHLVGIIEDITERKRAESALRESEEKYRLLVENIKEGIYSTHKGVFTSVNESMSRMFGYSRKELIGMPSWNLAVPEIRNSVKDMFFEKAAKKDYSPIEVKCVRKDGSVFIAEVRLSDMYEKQRSLGIVSDITERKRAEEELIRLSNAVRMSTDSIVISDLEGKIIDVNEATLKMYGTEDKEDLIGKDSIGLIAPEDRKKALEGMEEALKEGYSKSREYHVITKNGSRIPVEINSAVMKDLEGKSIGFVGITRDITERKRAEEKLKLFSHSVDSSVDGVAMGNLEGRITYVNETFVRMFGYSREELIGKEIAFIYLQDQIPKLKEALKATLEGDWRGELVAKRKDDEPFPIMVSSSRVVDDEGKVIAHMASHTDITERKQAEEALRESEKRYRALFKGAAEGILVADIETKEFKYVNPAICRMLGYTEEELKRMNVVDVHPKDALERVISEFKAHARGEKTLATGIPCLRKDGTTIYAHINTARVLIDGRECSVGLFTDITERKRAEEALIRNERIARERARLLTDLRNLDRIDDILTRVCEAARDSGLFERAVMTLHDQVRQIVHLGQVGLPPDVVKRARQAPPIDQETRARITSKKFRISDSFFVPAEAGVDFSKTGRYVPQKRRKSVGGDWQPGDELFVPLRDFSGKIMGFLSVDTPTDGCRPDVKTIQTLEMIVEAAASRVREVEAREVLKRERDFSQSIIGTANSMIICLDANAKITVFNQECEQVTGYRREEVIGKRWPELFLPPDHHHFKLKSFANWVRAHPHDRYEGPIVTKSGEIRTILWSNTAILGSGKKEIVAIAIGHDITERKRAEKALQTSENKYRTLLENLPQKIFLKDRNSVYVSCNESYARDLKIKSDEIAGKTDYDFFPKELAEKYRADDKRIMELGKTEDVEERYIQERQEVFVHTVKTPVKDEQGNLIGLLGIFWDITERKRAVEALQRSERKYRTLVETAQEGIGIADPKENLIFINQAFADLLGYRKEELLGKNLKEISDEAQYVMFKKEPQKRKKGESSKYEAKLLTKRGKPKYFYVSAAPLWNEDGSFMGTLAVLSDLTDIKKAREYNVLLNTSRELSRTLRLDQLLKIGAEKMIQVLNADRCAVLLMEDDAFDSMIKVKVYPSKKGKVSASVLNLRTTKEHFFSYKRSLQTQGYLEISDVRVDPVSALGRKILHKAGMLSSLIIPIFLGKTMLVVFHVGMTNKTRVFSSEEVRLVQTMANQVTVALQNCRLMEDLKKEHSRITEQAKALKKQTQEKDILLKVSRALSKTMDLDEVSKVGSHVVGSALGVERCAVALATPDGNQLEIKSLFSKEQIDLRKLIGTKFSWDDIPAMSKAIKKGKSIAINNTSDLSSKSKTREYCLKVGIKSVLGAGMFFGKKLIGILSITSIKEYKTFSREEVKLVQTIANQIAVAIENARLLQVIKKHTRDLKELSSQLMKVQEKERKKIAQELHDEVGQMLQSMKMNLDRIKRNLSSKPRKLEGIEDWLLDTEKLLGQTIDDIRTLTFDLRPSMLDDFGLIPTLRWYVENYSRRSNIKVSLKTKDQRCRFPQDIEVTLYRIIQEALTNVAKHAHATEATILVSKKDSTAVSSVRDNGGGFDAEKVLSHPKGMGLLNIKERVNLYGGSFEIISRPRKGTTLNINIPFKEVKHEEGQITGS